MVAQPAPFVAQPAQFVAQPQPQVVTVQAPTPVVAAPATPGAAHYLQQQHTYSHHQHQQQQPAQLIKKNIYEVPKVEPIYSTPIEIFYPSSPSSLSTASSECEALQRPHTLASSTPRTQADTLDSYKSPRMQKFEDLVTFSPIYSYFSPAVEPKYSNIV